MKTHAIIPIFIPHLGCPHDCIFCNQKKITSVSKPVTIDDVERIIEMHLETLQNGTVKTIEIAFYGGSFTGIPMEDQSDFLAVAKKYKDAGLIEKIRLSTRPDYIDHDILTNLKKYSVDIIELGAQSFDEEVLSISNRGHTVENVYESSKLIKDYGFQLGIQLMVGLPGDTAEKDVYSARQTALIRPEFGRIYPTVVLENTGLFQMQADNEYEILSLKEAVNRTKDMYIILKNAGINVIRIGLKNDFGTYHPAFRQLVEGEIAKDEMEKQLKRQLTERVEKDTFLKNQFTVRGEKGESVNDGISNVFFYSNEKSFSNMVGNKNVNRRYFKEKYPWLNFKFQIDDTLQDGKFKALYK